MKIWWTLLLLVPIVLGSNETLTNVSLKYCPSHRQFCAKNETCCPAAGHTDLYGCCPSPWASCCPDGKMCCVRGFRCITEGGIQRCKTRHWGNRTV